MASFLKPLLRLCQIIFTLFLVYFALRIATYHLVLATFPFPVSLREGAMMTNTDALVKGLNPYDMSLQPQLMNPYGIIYPLLIWPWAKLFGTTILIHRAATAFFILSSCVLIFLVLRKMAVSILLSIWAVLMFYSSLTFPGTSTPTIDPGAAGMFFLLLTVFIPWSCQYSYKSLAISVLLGIIAFYTKPYAFLGVLIMLSYLFLFISKKKSFFYAALLLLLSTISIMAVNRILPAYFDNCFFASLNMTHAWSSMERLHLQINLYTHLHQWTLILMGVCILTSVIARNEVTKQSLKTGLLRFARSDIMLVLWAGMWSAFVLYISLGRHSGAMLWYFFQLLSPFLLVGAAWTLNRHAYWPVWCAPFLIFNLYTMSLGQDYKLFNKNAVGWSELSRVISQYQTILNSPLIAPLLIEQNKQVFDNGQTEYFLSGAQRNGLMRDLFKEDNRVYIQMILFFNNLKNKIENKKFDMIILQPSLLPLGVGDDIKKYYKFEGQLLLYEPQDLKTYAVTVWRPL